MSEDEEDGGGTYIDASGVRDREANATPMPEPEKKKRDGLYIIIIVMLLLAGGFLGWTLSEKNEQINNCQNERDELVIEMEGLNEMMYDQGLDMGEDVKENLQNMLAMYDKMEIDNGDMNDSIQAQKDKIASLITELEDAKGDKAYYASKVYKLNQETQTLRSIMKDYIRTIDSLNVANGVLTESLAETLSDLDETQTNLTNVTSERDDLSDKVNKGSKLSAFGFTSEGIKEKGSGSYKETTKAGRCTHVRSCFTIGDNSIASKGNRTVYMRVTTPGGSVLNSSQSNTFKTEAGQSLLYSDKKTINYQNQSVDICIFHRLTVELTKGNYVAQIYCDGVMIGSDTFVLK
jgi:hypothetical protein